jgi:hypothetical protein
MYYTHTLTAHNRSRFHRLNFHIKRSNFHLKRSTDPKDLFVSDLQRSLLAPASFATTDYPLDTSNLLQPWIYPIITGY